MHNSLIPNLMVEDVAKTVKFYQDVLGFAFIAGIKRMHKEMAEGNVVMELSEGLDLDWANVKLGDPDSTGPEFMFQSRESFESDVPALNGADISASQTLYMQTENADAQFNRLKNKVDVVLEPVTRFYGMREWYMKDINGYVLCFGEELG